MHAGVNAKDGKGRFGTLLLGAAFLALLLPAAADAASGRREPLVLPQVGDTFEAAYDAVWDATLRNLGVLKTPVADKATGRIETEPFPFAFTVGSAPGGARGLVHRAALGSAPIRLAQDGNDGKATQVLWFSMLITVRRAGANRTDVLVVPRIHESLLLGFTPGPTNSPWGDLFAKIRSSLGRR